MKAISRFKGREATKDYLQALSAMNNVPPGERDRVFADSIAEHIEERFAEVFKLKKSSGRVCIQKLLGKRCGLLHQSKQWKGCECSPPGTDHPSLWIKDGKPAVFVSQPYGITAKMLQEMQEFADKYGLEFDVGAEMSWWFPSRTVLVCWRVKGNRVISNATQRGFL